MRRRSFLLAATATGLAGSARAKSKAPVVLELFTSQGCSSCPPADALLGRLAAQPGVIALAWHIDYWNGLGWRDPYATRFATDRQRAYAARLREEVYTPALVVNGATMVVGSDMRAVASAMTTAPAVALPITLRRDPAGIAADIGAAPEPLTALFVAYDTMRTTAVGGGENGGRRLTEYHIVREAQSVAIPAGATGPFRCPAPDPARGVALLVQSADLRVRGAAFAPPIGETNKSL